jgi:hypothetical protein
MANDFQVFIRFGRFFFEYFNNGKKVPVNSKKLCRMGTGEDINPEPAVLIEM